MPRILAALALAFVLATPCHAQPLDGTRPDPVLTPGEVRSTDAAAICATDTRTIRRVSATMKIAARRAYGITGPHAGWCGKAGCEIDHRVPLGVGGGNTPGSIRNLWPERPTGPLSYHVKDRCERLARTSLCAGRITVEQAQGIFLGDWVTNCRAAFGETRRARGG